MNPWSGRLALLAYAIGGWLLPALHHHDHACQHATVEAGAHHQCEHHHAHSHSHSEPTQAALSLVAVESQDHVGHCVLCAGRTLAKLTGEKSRLASSDHLTQIVSVETSQICIQSPRSANRMRGAPIVFS